MLKNLLFSVVILAATTTSASYAQEPDSIQIKKVNFFSKSLSVDKAKAQQVTLVMDNYKRKAYEIIADKTL